MARQLSRPQNGQLDLAKFRQSLAKCETPQDALSLLGKAEGVAEWLQRIESSREAVWPAVVAILEAKATIGELSPREQGKRTDITSSGTQTKLSKESLAAYRKLADHREKLEEYCAAVWENKVTRNQQSVDYPSAANFIDWIGGGGNIASKFTGDVEWYTPEVYIEKARQVLGEIDLDPASNDAAQDVVQAGTYYTESEDGLEHEWFGRVWLNPPYAMPAVENFVFRLCDEVESGAVTAAVLLTNNCTDPKWWQRAARLASAVCFTSGRISFYNDAGESSSPTNGQTFCYFGRARKRFEKHFGDVGLIL